MNLWVDADPSGLVWTGLDCDDDLAIVAVLAQTSPSFSFVGLTICGGNAPLAQTWANIQAFWQYIDFESPGLKFLPNHLQPIRGHGWRSMQLSRGWLRMLNFLAPDMEDSAAATDAIKEAILNTPSVSSESRTGLTILTLGPSTNVARAIEQLDDDGLLANQTNLKHVYMMGGELTNGKLDLNFATDRAAARILIESPSVPVTLIPIQLCAQVILDKTFVERFEKEFCSLSLDHASRTGEIPTRAAACAILPKMKQQVSLMPKFVNQAVAKRLPDSSRWKQSPNLNEGFIPWDVLAVLVVTHPHLFDDFEYHRVGLEGCAEGEPCNMSMAIFEDIAHEAGGIYNHSGIVRIPHLVKNEALVLETIHDLLGRIPSVKGKAPPGMQMGFLSQLTGILLGTILLLGISCRK